MAPPKSPDAPEESRHIPARARAWIRAHTHIEYPSFHRSVTTQKARARHTCACVYTRIDRLPTMPTVFSVTLLRSPCLDLSSSTRSTALFPCC